MRVCPRGVSVPCGAGTGFEGDACALDEGRVGGLEERVDANHAGEPVGGPFHRDLGAAALDVHSE